MLRNPFFYKCCKGHSTLTTFPGGGVGKLQGKSVECPYRSPKTIDRFFCVHGVLYPSDYNTGANHKMIQRHNRKLKEELSNVRGALSVEVCNNSEAVGSAGISMTNPDLHMGSKDY